MSLKNLFKTEVRQALAGFSPKHGQETVTPEALAPLPAAVQGYLSSCGYLGKPGILNFFMEYEHAQIKLKPDGKWMNRNCVQFNAVAPANRLALMRANMYGLLPLGARDKYRHGHGNMLIKRAGLTISHARGPKWTTPSLLLFWQRLPCSQAFSFCSTPTGKS